MCAQLHFNICKEIEVKLDNKHWYIHILKSVKTSYEGKVTMLWNQQVRTNRSIPNNKLDIIIHDNKKRNTHVNRRYNSWRQKCDKKRSWEDFKICLITQIQCMWNLKAKAIPVITGATGTISKSQRLNLSNIPGKHKIKELKTNSHLGTAHILQKVLM